MVMDSLCYCIVGGVIDQEKISQHSDLSDKVSISRKDYDADVGDLLLPPCRHCQSSGSSSPSGGPGSRGAGGSGGSPSSSPPSSPRPSWPRSVQQTSSSM